MPDTAPRDTARLIYLDNNATTRPLPEVVETVAYHMSQSYGNPGSQHPAGRAARRVLEDARESMAWILGAKPSEVIFTSGGTEATNLAILGCRHRGLGRILRTAGEHPATIESCAELERHGWTQQILCVDPDGRLQLGQIESLTWDQVQLATVILAHNETGVVQDVGPLAAHCSARGVPFHLDAVQAAGKIPVDFHRLRATSLALGAHKFHGPRGIGALLLRDGFELAATQFGGHQESGRRPGTELVALAAGMAKALELWHTEQTDRAATLASLRDRLELGLQQTCAPTVVNGSRAHRLPNTLNISFLGLDGESLLVALYLAGVACSLGSTCASGSSEPAPSLLAMNCPPEVYRSAVRFSLGIHNRAGEIDEAIDRISEVVTRMRRQPTT